MDTKKIEQICDEGIASDQHTVLRNLKIVDPYDGPHAKRYRQIKEELSQSPQGGEYGELPKKLRLMAEHHRKIEAAAARANESEHEEWFKDFNDLKRSIHAAESVVCDTAADAIERLSGTGLAGEPDVESAFFGQLYSWLTELVVIVGIVLAFAPFDLFF